MQKVVYWNTICQFKKTSKFFLNMLLIAQTSQLVRPIVKDIWRVLSKNTMAYIAPVNNIDRVQSLAYTVKIQAG